jgi:hypothetical protein
MTAFGGNLLFNINEYLSNTEKCVKKLTVIKSRILKQRAGMLTHRNESGSRTHNAENKIRHEVPAPQQRGHGH